LEIQRRREIAAERIKKLKEQAETNSTEDNQDEEKNKFEIQKRKELAAEKIKKLKNRESSMEDFGSNAVLQKFRQASKEVADETPLPSPLSSSSLLEVINNDESVKKIVDRMGTSTPETVTDSPKPTRRIKRLDPAEAKKKRQEARKQRIKERIERRKKTGENVEGEDEDFLDSPSGSRIGGFSSVDYSEEFPESPSGSRMESSSVESIEVEGN